MNYPALQGADLGGSFLKNISRKLMRLLGYRIVRESPPAPEDLLPFLRRLWPVATDMPLVRFGGDGDGAYLMPDDLADIRALFSPGVEAVASFETDMTERGMICYMADASVEAPPFTNPAFRFLPKFLGLRDTERFTTLDSWVDAYEPGDHDLLLQMDIEGAEWTVLSHASSQLLRRFRIIVLEVHALSQLLDQYGKQIVTEVFSRLLETHHLVHSHPNNMGRLFQRQGVDIPDVMEMTFLRKDRATAQEYAGAFPHPLDVVNGPHQPALVLPAGWHAPSGTQEKPPV